MDPNMTPEQAEEYMRSLQQLHNLQAQAFSSSPVLAALISSLIPQSGVAATPSAANNSIPEGEEVPISSSAPTTSSTLDDMATVSNDDFQMRLLLQLLQNQLTATTAVSTAASMPNLNLIGSLPFSMPPPTTVPSSLAGLSLLSSTGIPSSTNFLEQHMAMQSSLMRPRVNSAASSSTSSSSLSSPNPTSSPERRRKRARSLLIKAEEAAAKISQDAKLKRSDVLAEMIVEDEQQRRELAASVMAASANGTLTTLKSASPATNGLCDEFPKITLRPLIPEAALPETVGPDSPFRHHPKYQKKNQDAALDFNLGQSLASFNISKDLKKKDGEDSGTSSTSSSLSSLGGNPEALKMMFSKFMDDVISGELVAST